MSHSKFSSPQTDSSISKEEQEAFKSTINDDTLNATNVETFLVINFHDFKLGMSIYHKWNDSIELVHEVYEYLDFNYISKILIQLQPTDIIISSKCNSILIEFLKSFSRNSHEIESNNSNSENDSSSESVPSMYVSHNENEVMNSYPSFKLHIVSNLIFQYEDCKTRILSADFPQFTNMIDIKERFIYLSSSINFSECRTIVSLGVMLYFLVKNAIINNFYKICKITYYNYYYVAMDQTTFEALEIFQQEWHPSTSRNGIYKKEGLSVFGIFNICASKVGAFQLRKQFQQPITEFDLLKERLDLIEFFVNPINKDLRENLFNYLKEIKDISPIMKRIKAANFQLSDFSVLFSVTLVVISIRNLIKKYCKLPLISKIVNGFVDEFNELIDFLKTAIDFEKSKKTNCIEIRKGFDNDLDILRTVFNKLPEILNDSLLDESEEGKFFMLNLRHITNVYIPQLGFLTSIPLVQAQSIPNIDSYGLDLIFCAHDMAYYKSKKMREFDMHFGDIKSEINDRTHQILLNMKIYILNQCQILQNLITLCGQLDLAISMAQVAINYNYVRPKLTCSGIIKIENCRHPLYELLGEQSFVPNSYLSDNEQSKVTLIYGPNGCGKSVYLKQISLVVFLAHIGSYVPAKSAEITIIDQIFTRIKTPESISTLLSSFKHDLNQIAHATNYATQRSLIVIDSFGKGTLLVDGQALLSACINHWLKDINQPHIIVSCQFNLIPILQPLNKVKFFTFQQTASKTFSFYLVELSTANSSFSNLIEHQGESVITSEVESFSKNLENSFPKLNKKYKKYLQLADHLIECNLDESLDNSKIAAILNLLNQSVTIETNNSSHN